MKTITWPVAGVLLLFAASCTKARWLTPQPAAERLTPALPLLTLLANTLAAVSFYVNSAGTHGLIVDTVDLVPATWYNGTYTITGVT